MNQEQPIHLPKDLNPEHPVSRDDLDPLLELFTRGGRAPSSYASATSSADLAREEAFGTKVTSTCARRYLLKAGVLTGASLSDILKLVDHLESFGTLAPFTSVTERLEELASRAGVEPGTVIRSFIPSGLEWRSARGYTLALELIEQVALLRETHPSFSVDPTEVMKILLSLAVYPGTDAAHLSLHRQAVLGVLRERPSFPNPPAIAAPERRGPSERFFACIRSSPTNDETLFLDSLLQDRCSGGILWETVTARMWYLLHESDELSSAALGQRVEAILLQHRAAILPRRLFAALSVEAFIISRDCVEHSNIFTGDTLARCAVFVREATAPLLRSLHKSERYVSHHEIFSECQKRLEAATAGWEFGGGGITILQALQDNPEDREAQRRFQANIFLHAISCGLGHRSRKGLSAQALSDISYETLVAMNDEFTKLGGRIQRLLQLSTNVECIGVLTLLDQIRSDHPLHEERALRAAVTIVDRTIAFNELRLKVAEERPTSALRDELLIVRDFLRRFGTYDTPYLYLTFRSAREDVPPVPPIAAWEEALGLKSGDWRPSFLRWCVVYFSDPRRRETYFGSVPRVPPEGSPSQRVSAELQLMVSRLAAKFDIPPEHPSLPHLINFAAAFAQEHPQYAGIYPDDLTPNRWITPEQMTTWLRSRREQAIRALREGCNAQLLCGTPLEFEALVHTLGIFDLSFTPLHLERAREAWEPYDRISFCDRVYLHHMRQLAQGGERPPDLRLPEVPVTLKVPSARFSEPSAAERAQAHRLLESVARQFRSFRTARSADETIRDVGSALAAIIERELAALAKSWSKERAPSEAQVRKQQLEERAQRFRNATTVRELFEVIGSSRPLSRNRELMRGLIPALLTLIPESKIPRLGEIESNGFEIRACGELILATAHLATDACARLEREGKLPRGNGEQFSSWAFGIREIEGIFALFVGERGKEDVAVETVASQKLGLNLMGYLCDTCAVRVFDPAADRPNMFFCPFIDRATELTQPAVYGGTGVIVTTAADGEKCLLIRGFNPRSTLLNRVHAGDLFEQFCDSVLVSYARSCGATRILIPNDLRVGFMLSNREPVIRHLRKKYGVGSYALVKLQDPAETTFNDMTVTSPCIEVRQIPRKS